MIRQRPPARRDALSLTPSIRTDQALSMRKSEVRQEVIYRRWYRVEREREKERQVAGGRQFPIDTDNILVLSCQLQAISTWQNLHLD